MRRPTRAQTRFVFLTVLVVILLAVPFIRQAIADNPHPAATPVPGAGRSAVNSGQAKCYAGGSEIPCPAGGRASSGKDARPGDQSPSTAQSGSASLTSLKLPDTGQVTDYTPTFGEDADYTLNPPAYTDNGNRTVTDQVTGLVWQQGDGGEMTFSNAVAYCETLELGGYADWQLPSGHQLFGIVDHDHNPALNSAYSPATNAEYWWTANEQVGDSTKAWVVNAGGGIGAHPKSETISAGGTKRFQARCVRNVPVSLPMTFVNSGDGTVTHSNTGLVWQQAEVTPALSWEAALSFCENLTLGGRSDWRVPNIKELRSISDDTRFRPSVDATYFPGVQAARYWSSTTLAGRSGSAWYVDFSSGLASYNDKIGQLSLRCVRSDPAAPVASL